MRSVEDYDENKFENMDRFRDTVTELRNKIEQQQKGIEHVQARTDENKKGIKTIA